MESGEDSIDLEALVEQLKQEYDLPQTQIKIISRPPIRFVEGVHGTTYKQKKKEHSYTLELVGEPKFPLCVHEFLHVVLEETGRFLETTSRKKDHQEYFYWLKHVLDEYLIETEFTRKFGLKYQDFYAQRQRENFALAALRYGSKWMSPTSIFLYLLSVRTIATNVYPELQEIVAARVMRDILQSPCLDGVVSISQDYHFATTTPQHYQTFAQRVHHALTDSGLAFRADHKVVFERKSVDALVTEFNAAFRKLSRASFSSRTL